MGCDVGHLSNLACVRTLAEGGWTVDMGGVGMSWRRNGSWREGGEGQRGAGNEGDGCWEGGMHDYRDLFLSSIHKESKDHIPLS